MKANRNKQQQQQQQQNEEDIKRRDENEQSENRIQYKIELKRLIWMFHLEN